MAKWRFGLQGYHNVTTKDLATASNIPEGAIYIKFGSKAGVYGSIIYDVAKQFHTDFIVPVLNSVVQPGRPIASAFVEATQSWFPGFSKLDAMLLGQILYDPALSKTAARAIERSINSLAITLKRLNIIAHTATARNAARSFIERILWCKVFEDDQVDVDQMLRAWFRSLKSTRPRRLAFFS